MKKLLYTLFLTFASVIPGLSQSVIEIEPLFQYPVAPEELESLEDKCNYLVKNFWNNFDFKAKNPVDQYALNEAFQVYVTTFQYASPKDVDQSVEKLIKNISGNPILLLQFGKAAEENLYGPRADFWSDSLYLKFVEAIVHNKKIAANRKTRYINQLETLNNSGVGKTAPTFWFEDRERASKQYFPMSTPTLLIFGNPDDTDWRLARLKMESNFKLSEALEKGKVNILFILPSEVDNWQDMVSNYNRRWTTGYSSDVSKIYDIRMIPTTYIIGSDGKIKAKNLPFENAVEILLENQ